MAVVLGDAVCLPQAPLMKDVLNGQQQSVASDVLCRIQPLSVVICGIPYQTRDAACQQARGGASVEVCEDAGVHAKLTPSPQKVECVVSK